MTVWAVINPSEDNMDTHHCFGEARAEDTRHPSQTNWHSSFADCFCNLLLTYLSAFTKLNLWIDQKQPIQHLQERQILCVFLVGANPLADKNCHFFLQYLSYMFKDICFHFVCLQKFHIDAVKQFHNFFLFLLKVVNVMRSEPRVDSVFLCGN